MDSRMPASEVGSVKDVAEKALREVHEARINAEKAEAAAKAQSVKSPPATRPEPTAAAASRPPPKAKPAGTPVIPKAVEPKSEPFNAFTGTTGDQPEPKRSQSRPPGRIKASDRSTPMIFDSDGERCMPTDVQVIVRFQKRLATVSITLPAEEQFRTLLEAVRSTHPAEMDSPCPIGFLLGANENGLGGYVVSLDQSLSSVGITPRTHVVGERIMLKYYIVTGMVGTPTKKDPERAELILNLHDHGNLWCEPEDPGMTLEQGLGALAFTDKIESDRKQERKAWRESLKKEAHKPAAQEWTPWNTSQDWIPDDWATRTKATWKEPEYQSSWSKQDSWSQPDDKSSGWQNWSPRSREDWESDKNNWVRDDDDWKPRRWEDRSQDWRPSSSSRGSYPEHRSLGNIQSIAWFYQ
jgi:hypothetical protein